jgi:hypothetical protein
MAKVLSSITEIHQVADSLEPQLRREFIKTIRRLNGNVNLTQIAALISLGQIAKVMERIGLKDEFAQFQSEALVAVHDLVQKGAAVAALPKGVSISFDMTNPQVFSVIRNDVIDKVLKISAETEAAIRAAIERSFMEGIPTLQIAREIRDLVGLTQNGWKTVGRYDEYLRGLADRFTEVADLSKTAEGMLRKGGMRNLLTEKRGLGVLDRTGLTNERIESLVQKYTDRLIARRAETIARTLTIDASAEGQAQLWKQAVEKGELDEADWDVIWIVTKDDRLCDECLEMEGERRPIDGTYENGEGPPTLHPG